VGHPPVVTEWFSKQTAWWPWRTGSQAPSSAELDPLLCGTPGQTTGHVGSHHEVIAILRTAVWAAYSRMSKADERLIQEPVRPRCLLAIVARKGQNTVKGGTLTIRRVINFVMALATVPIAAMIAAVGPFGVPAASAAVGPLVTCRSMQSQSSILTSPAILNDCNRPRFTGGSGTNNQAGPPPFPIVWASGKAIYFNCGGGACGGPPSSFPVPGRCPASLTEFDFVGTVTSTLGPWTKRYIGDPLEFDICLTSAFAVAELVPGTKFMILRP
jgi:hypothetical protein